MAPVVVSSRGHPLSSNPTPGRSGWALWDDASRSYPTCSSHPSRAHLAGDTRLEYEQYARLRGIPPLGSDGSSSKCGSIATPEVRRSHAVSA